MYLRFVYCPPQKRWLSNGGDDKSIGKRNMGINIYIYADIDIYLNGHIIINQPITSGALPSRVELFFGKDLVGCLSK